jgi:hypothetical protein
MATHPKKAVPKTALEAFAAAKPDQHIALLLWKNRHPNPDLAVTVTEADLKAYMDCMSYLKVTPEVKVVLRKNYVGIVLVQEGTGDETSPGNAIKVVENNEADAQKGEAAEAIKRMRERAPDLAYRLEVDAQAGTFSADMVIEAARTMRALLGAG